MDKRIHVKAGDRYGRLTVIREVKPQVRPCGRQKRMVACMCDCGTTRVVQLGHLRSGGSASCGCARDENFNGFKHGYVGTPTYRVWQGMRKRCYNPENKSYHNYGGRGISVCDRWLTFENFLEDMGERPDGLTIERVDNNGDYEPGNCRWASRAEQSRNTRRNRLLTHGGETLCMKTWSERAGIDSNTIYRRLKRGWSIEDTLMTPPGTRRRQCRLRQ